MGSQTRREEMFAEYYKLWDFVQGYDNVFLSIKTWGVTLSSAAIGLAFIQSSVPTFLIAFFLALSFWLTETRYKLFQLTHLLRVVELEDALRDNLEIQAPRIYHAFGEESANNARVRRWRLVMFWPQVMLPHLFFVLISGVAGIVQILVR